MNMTSRPLIQDLVKEALSKDAQRAKIAAEGARQMNLAEESSKEASASTSEESVTTDFAMKLASAVEYALPEIVKSASIHLSGGGTHPAAAPPEGVSVSAQTQVQPFTPGSQGKGHHQPPTHPGLQASNHGPATQMENTINHPPGGTGTQTTAMSGGKGKVAEAEKCKGCDKEKDACTCSKTASPVNKTLAKLAGLKVAEFPPPKKDGDEKKDGDDKGEKKAPPFAKKDDEKKEAQAPSLVDAFLSSTKVAEDAINPAKISAGAAVPPDTSAAGEPGGAPVAGMPQGPRGLVHSNESAKNYKKDQAYAPRKAELKQYFNEPALSSATDKTLQQAFAHTGEAGVKISSAEAQVKTAAARAILMKLADSTAKKAGE